MEKTENLNELKKETEFPIFNHIKTCRHGQMIYNTHDIYMGRALEYYGEYSEFEAHFFNSILQPGWVALDVGANIGCHTVIFAQKVGPRGRVYAFEPQRILFQTLCANIAINNISNTFCENIALGATEGIIEVPLLDMHHDNNFGALSLDKNFGIRGENIPLKKLDDYHFPSVNFIKIDVEGMETPVLEGAEHILKTFKPILFIENDRIEKSQMLIEKLFEFEYRLYWAITPLYNPHNFFQNPENIYGNTVTINMLCIHKSVPQNIQLPEITDSQQNFQDFLRTQIKV